MNGLFYSSLLHDCFGQYHDCMCAHKLSIFSLSMFDMPWLHLLDSCNGTGRKIEEIKTRDIVEMWRLSWHGYKKSGPIMSCHAVITHDPWHACVHIVETYTDQWCSDHRCSGDTFFLVYKLKRGSVLGFSAQASRICIWIVHYCSALG